MSFLSRAFSGASPPQETRAFEQYYQNIPSVYEDARMQAAVIPEGSAMSLGAFYACVTLLADTIASLPIKAYRRDKMGVRELVNPQPPLLNGSPYPDLTWFDWLWMMMESLAITGNAYGYITSRNKEDFQPKAIMPIHPSDISVEELDGEMGWPEPVYRIGDSDIDPMDIMHVRRYPIANCVKGMSPIQKAASAVGLGLAAEQYGLNYFRDSANPSGILSTDQELTADQAKRNMKQWVQSHQGRRRPAILSDGLKWMPISIAPNESQFLETRQFQVSDIARWFRIPPHMIGDTEKSTSWGTGIEEQAIGFVTYTLRPWLTCIEQCLTKMLPRGQFAKFDIDELLRGDVKARWEAYKMGREAGVYSVNEIRAKEDLAPIGEEGDTRLQPSNHVLLGTDTAELQKELQQNKTPANGTARKEDT